MDQQINSTLRRQDPYRKRLTDAVIDKLPIPEAGRPVVYDELVREFCVRLSPAGGKVFYVYKRVEDKPQFVKVGKFPNMATVRARARARKILADIEEGVNPNRDKKLARREITLGALWDEFMKRHLKPNRRRWDVEERCYKKDIEQWAGRRLSEITRRDVIVLLDGIVDRGAPIGANRVHGLLGHLFNFAIQRDAIPFSPMHGLKAPSKKKVKTRVLLEPEIRDFWTGLDNMPAALPTRLILRLILVTMQRPGEVAGMLKGELDLESGWWDIPGERTKNKKPHRAPLSGTAIKIIKSIPESDWPHVFPGQLKPSKPVGVNTVAGGVLKALETGAFPECEKFTPHDLRRTGASLVRSPRISEAMTGMLLNHSTGTITGRVYSIRTKLHEGYEEKRRVVMAWERNLQKILDSSPEEKVIQLVR